MFFDTNTFLRLFSLSCCESETAPQTLLAIFKLFGCDCSSHADVTHVGADDDRHPLNHVHKYLALPSLENTHTDQMIRSQDMKSSVFFQEVFSPAGTRLFTEI